MAYLEIGKGVCHNASEGRRHSRGASIIEIGAACGTFIMGVDPTTDTTDSVCKSSWTCSYTLRVNPRP